jgi:hypothetical protein
MAAPLYTPLNQLATTVASGGYTAGSGTLTLAPGYGAVIAAEITAAGAPAISATHPIRVSLVVLARANDSPIAPAFRTVLEATGLSGDVLTIAGAIEGTTDRNYSPGSIVRFNLTAGAISEIQALVALRDHYLAYEDFSRFSNGALSALLTGQTWIQNATGQPTQISAVAGGTMGAPSTGHAAYPTVDLGSGVLPGLTWCTIVFGASGTTGSAAVLISSDTNPIVLTSVDRLVHFVVDEIGWTFGTFTSGTLTLLGSGSYAAPLVCDGVTRYLCGFLITGNTITLYLPDGTIQRFTNSLIGTYNGRYVTFESYLPSSTRDVRFGKVAVESSDLTKLPLTAPGFDDLWTALADSLAMRATLAANTFTDIQTILKPSGTGGLVIGQDTLKQWRFALGNNNLLYLQGSTDAFATAYTMFTFNCTTGAYIFGAPVNVTGSRGGNAALASLLTALAGLGLITDSTT